MRRNLSLFNPLYNKKKPTPIGQTVKRSEASGPDGQTVYKAASVMLRWVNQVFECNCYLRHLATPSKNNHRSPSWVSTYTFLFILFLVLCIFKHNYYLPLN